MPRSSDQKINVEAIVTQPATIVAKPTPKATVLATARDSVFVFMSLFLYCLRSLFEAMFSIIHRGLFGAVRRQHLALSVRDDGR